MPHDKHAAHARLVQRLRDQADDIRRLASGLDETTLASRAKPEQWSIKEVVCHLWRLQDVFHGRIEAMLAQPGVAIASYAPDGDTVFEERRQLTLAEILNAFHTGRSALSERLEALAPGDWHARGQHPDFPHYDVHFCVEYMAHHEAHHIYQIYQRRSPFGPVPH